MIATTAISMLLVGAHFQDAPKRPPTHIKKTVKRAARPLRKHVDPEAAADGQKASRVVYRKDDRYVVWDSRGLTIRSGNTVKSSRLADISLTPKLFSRDQILETKKLISDGVRAKGASALSGSRRLGDVVYLVPRWDTSDGTPWLEALVKVDLSQAAPQAQLLGRYEGLSLAHQKVGDKLFLVLGMPALITRKGDSWGVATFDTSSFKFAFTPAGKDLVTYWYAGPHQLFAEEKTPYGSRTMLRVDISTGDRRILAESRTGFVLLSANPPLARLATSEGDMVRNLDTGSEMKVPKGALLRVTPLGVLVSPKNDASNGTLYEPVRWNKVVPPAGG